MPEPLLAVTLTKVGDLYTIPDHPIAEGYRIEGLMAPGHGPAVGQRFRLLRTERPAREGEPGERVATLGFFETSAVESVERQRVVDETALTHFTTANSRYRLLIHGPLLTDQGQAS